MNTELDRLSEVLAEMNAIGNRISDITGRPATIGHTGEYIASRIFDIELEESASAKAIDGRFRSGKLAGRTVNIKWYGKLEYMLDITPDELPDFYLVMTGPKNQGAASRGGIRPWVISHVFLFKAEELVRELRARGVKIGTATSVVKHEWEAAEIYPNQRNLGFRPTEDQMAQLLAFGANWAEDWF